jgi:class 3 adenylate cyclase/tetratricopeptide (TPR) repeat protein
MAQLSTESAETLRPYVPRLTIRWLAEQPHLTFRTVEGSMVFVDISGFTKMSERLARHGKVGAEEVTDVLGAVFAKLLAVAYGEDGSLLKFGGDALLLWFSGVGHAARAASAASGMRATLRSVGRLDTTAGKVVLRMSVGVNSGSFHFFLVGDSHRELVVTGPAASQTVTMESTATAGEILVSRDTAALLPAETVGRSKGEGLLLKRGPSTLAFDRDDKEVPLGSLDVTLCVPTALRDHLLSGFAEPEHRTATVAFVHFDGVDDRVMSRGADVVAAELHELVCCVQAAAEANGVTFLGTDIDHDGGKIILTGGAPNALGDDEGRMLLTLRAVIDAETALPVRIGVNRGPVFAGDIGPAYRRTYTVMGDAVNLAARVMSMAVPGQILSTGPVLDASSVAFNALPLEPFMVKGKKHPVYAFMVGHSTGSKPETVSREFPLVGRDAEMEAFRRALLELRGGHGSVLEVVGNAGMGKTRLLSEFRAEAPDLPQLVTGCELYESSAPYLPVRRLLRLLLGTGAATHASDVARRLEEDVRQRAPELLAWLPLLAIVADVEVPMTREVQDLGDEFRRAKLDEVTAEYLSRVIAEPTLVVIEDAHWMDEPSVDLLRTVSLRITELPWLICISRRDEATGFVLLEAPRCRSFPLSPLSSDARGELIAAATEEHPFLPYEVDELSDRSGGNPMFLQELLQAARSAGSVEGLPDSIQGIVMADIDRLTASDRTILRYASVLGMSFDADLVRALFEGEDELDGRTWDRLVQFIDNEGGGHYRFRHALMRDAAYEGLPYRRRRELHARAGDAIALAAGDLPEEQAELLSLHYLHAQRFAEAWEYSRIAGDRASLKYANSEAATFYSRSIDAAKRFTVPPSELFSIYEALGDVTFRMGEFRDAAVAYASARRQLAEDPIGRAKLLLKEAKIPYKVGRFTQTIRTIRLAMKTLDGVAGSEAERQYAELAAWHAHVRALQGRYAEAERWCRRVIDEVGSNAKDALAHAYFVLDFVYLDQGRVQDAVYSPTSLAIYEELENLAMQGFVLNNMGTDAYFRGMWDEAIQLYERARAIQLRLGDADGAALGTNNIGEIRSDQGRLSEAEQLFREVLRLSRAEGHQSLMAFALSNLGRVASRLGRYDESSELLERARALFNQIDERAQVLETNARIAELHLFRGDWQQALSSSAETLRAVEAAAGDGTQTPMLHRIRGYALMHEGRLGEAGDALDESLRVGRLREARFEIALTLEALARLAELRGTSADPKLRAESRSILERLGVESLPEVPLAAPSAVTPVE